MEILISTVLILSALLAGAISPGPSFVLVARMAMGSSRSDGIAAAFGMGLGGVIFAILALMGLQTVLARIPLLYFGLKIIGGLYLIYIAIRIWKGAHQILIVANEIHRKKSEFKRSFITGFFTQISNPITAFVYAGIFAALLPENIPSILYFVLPPFVFLIETGWYLTVALMLSSKVPQAAYLKTKSVFDRALGCVMAGLGIKLIASTADSGLS